MAEPIVMKIRLAQVAEGTYLVTMDVSDPKSGETFWEGRAALDLARLKEYDTDASGYGTSLYRDLFADSRLNEGFRVTLARAEASSSPLRVRFALDQSAASLHSIRWEMLEMPDTSLAFGSDPRIWFSRYIPSSAPYKLRPAKQPPAALFAIAQPRNLTDYNLSPLDSDGEIERFRQAAAGMKVDILDSRDSPLTMARLMQHLMNDEPDIFVLTAHSRFNRNRMQVGLFLEDEDGKGQIITDDGFVGEINRLARKPRLMVLNGCDTGGPEWDDGQLSLAAQLVAVGVPAVVAMHGTVTIETVQRYTPVFFRELLKTGLVDQAMTVGRMEIRMGGRARDWWSPVLFTSLGDGLLWQPPKPARKTKATAKTTPPVEESTTPKEQPPADPPAEQPREERSGVPIAELDHFQYSSSAREALERAKQLAGRGTKRRRPVTSSTLFYALIDHGESDPGTAAGFLRSYINRQPNTDFDNHRRIYFRGTHLISQEAEPPEGMKTIPPTEISPNLLRIARDASIFAERQGIPEIHLRHLVGSLIAAGREDGAQRRLEDMKIELPPLHKAFLEFLDPTLQRAQENRADWERFLTTGRPYLDTRPPLTGYSTDDTHRHKDLINIQRYVDAFAALIAARSVSPPLSIGLFGEWGSGKTFFMKQLQAAVDRLSADMRSRGMMQQELPFYKHIVQIEFNAWHYMEGNIWASLAEHIIDSLVHRGKDRTANAQMIELLESTLAVRKQASQAAEKDMKTASLQVQKAEENLRAAQTELDAKRTALTAQSVAKVSRDLVVEELRGHFDALGRLLDLKRVQGTADSMRATLTEAQKLAEESKGVLAPLKNAPDRAWRTAWLVSVPVITLLLFFGAYLLITRVNASLLTQVVGTLAALALAAGNALAWVKRQLVWGNKVRAFVEKLSAEYDQRVNAQMKGVTQQIEEMKKEVADLTVREQAAKALLEKARAEETAAYERVAQATPAHLLSGFLHDRADSADYRKHLGLLALVRRDFDTLSSLMESINWRMAPESAGIPRPGGCKDRYRDLDEERKEEAIQVNRIVLYIDDLDRCPPEKVVEVLQAVHLLLAFPLFVVVVGVDARWIKESLIARYRQLLHLESTDERHDPGENIFGKATPDDYLEKIFQIPFWLKPMDETASWNMIQGLLRPAALPAAGSNGGSTAREQGGDKQPSQEDQTEEAAQPSPEKEGVGTSGPAAKGPAANVPAADLPAADLPAGPSSTQKRPSPLAGVIGWLSARWESLLPRRQPAPAAQPTVEESTPEPESKDTTAKTTDNQRPVTPTPPPPDPARTEQAARSLEIYRDELAFMRCLAPLLGRSPRALKRFLNVYRLIKAGLTVEQLEDFAPAEPIGPPGTPEQTETELALKPDGAIHPYQAVLFLLAVDTGLPELARSLFEALDAPGWNPKASLTEQMAYLAAKLHFDEESASGEALEDQRNQLREWWQKNNPGQTGTIWFGVSNLNMLATWACYISRYSFQVYSPSGPLELA